MKQFSSTTILDKLFSSEFFKDIDTAALVKQYNISSGLRVAAAAEKLTVLPIIQAGTIISNIPPEGILINAAGQYEFSNDIDWTPLSPCPAITIQADNVVLDLKGYTLQANIKDTGSNYTGIEINEGSTVTVQNGTLKNMCYYGLSATSVFQLALNNIVIDGLAYQNVQTKLATPCGFFIDTSQNFSVQNCTVKNISVTSASCAGIQVIESVNGTISGCNLSDFVNYDGAVQGFSYLASLAIKTSGCGCVDFQSHYLGETQTSGHTVLGFIPILCVELIFENCSSTGMTGCCDDCHGMSIFLDAYIEVTNFTALNVIDGITPANTGAKATGLEVYGIGVTINNCSVENITAIVPQDLQSAGFSACGMQIVFNNCTAKNVIVTNAEGQPTTDVGYGAGFGWAPDPRSPFKDWAANAVTYNQCTATDCQLGFDTWFHTDSIWENISAPGCPVFILVQPQGTARTLSIDKCSESCDGLYHEVTINNIAANNTYPPIE